MAPLPQITASNASHYSNRPLVAVFIGGTSGIGEYSAQALAAQYAGKKAPLRMYIVGRSLPSAERIIAECTKTCSTGTFEFVQADDLTSIRDTDKVCRDITQLEEQRCQSDSPRIDVLIMTQGQLHFGPRQETAEGLDRSLSLLYYSRVRVITKLLPLLYASKSPQVISVFGAGLETEWHADDISLRKPENYGVIKVRSHTGYLTTMAFERLAREHPRLSLVHTFPGMVITPGYYESDFPLWVKVLWAIMGPIVRLFSAIPAAESGARTIYLGTSRFPSRAAQAQVVDAVVGSDDVKGSGAYAIGKDSEPVKMKASYGKLRKQSLETTVWEHTMKVFNDIEASGKFTG